MKFPLVKTVNLFLFLSLLNPTPALACRCRPLPEVAEAYCDASAVFSGKIVDIQTDRDFGRAVTIDVEQVWKGSLGQRVIVKTGTSQADCGYPFKRHRSYLIYAHGDMELTTSTCSRTRPLRKAKEDLKIVHDRSFSKQPCEAIGDKESHGVKNTVF